MAGPLDSSAIAQLLTKARGEWERNHFEAAERSLTSVLALAPGDARAVRMLGMVARRRGDYVKAVDCFRRVVAVWPDDPFLFSDLGLSLFSLGDVDEATTHFRRACELAPDSGSTWFNLGETLRQQACVEEAVAALQRTLALEPAHVEARLSLARAHASVGRIEAAVAEFRETVRRDPANADAWYGLSMNLASFDSADAACMQQHFDRGDLPARTHYLLGFALAKAVEDQGEYAKAFEVFQLANASQRESAPVRWVAAEERSLVEQTMNMFTRAITSTPDVTFGKEAILITGMPRTGSTLVEHILASHPDVEGANEIGDMQQIIEAEGQRRGSAFPAWALDATAQDWQRLGQDYLARTARWRHDKPRFTDKNLMSWHSLGAALAMLPAARVIIVRRDPVETCLACYRHCFTEEAGFACDLGDLADYHEGFLRLTRFWLEKYPARVFDLQYEALIADPEGVIRRTLDFCGLSFDPACLAFHETSRTVLTPSAAQVRQPLRRDTARSARYGNKLDRLRERLREARAPAG